MDNLPDRVSDNQPDQISDGNVDAPDKHKAVEIQEIHVQAVRLEGPLPPAQMLADYERVMPGLADRIVRMAELEQSHRQDLEWKEFEHPFAIARRGQILGLTAVLLFLSFAALLVIKGSPIVAGAVASIDIVAILVVFITGQAPRDTQGKQETKHNSEADQRQQSGAAPYKTD